MKSCLISVLVLTAAITSAQPPVDDGELTHQILKRAKRSVKTEGVSFLETMSNFLFFLDQGINIVGTDAMNSVLFSLDYVTPSFDYVMNSIYGRGYRLDERYKTYVQMFMTEDQIADHNHLMKIFKEDFNSDYDLYLKSGIHSEELYRTTVPINEVAMDYLGNAIGAAFPPDQQSYSEGEVVRGVTSVLQSFDGSRVPSNVFYVPQRIKVDGLVSNNGTNPVLYSDERGYNFYVTFVGKPDKPALSEMQETKDRKVSYESYQQGGHGKVMPVGSLNSHPAQIRPPGSSYQQSSGSGQIRPPGSSYQQSSSSGQVWPPGSSYQQSSSSGQVRPPGSESPMYPQGLAQKHTDAKSSVPYPYRDHRNSLPQYPPLRSADESHWQQSTRQRSLQNFEQKSQHLQKTSPQATGLEGSQSTYTSYEMPNARSRIDLAAPPSPESSSLELNTTEDNLGNLEGIPENFLEAGTGKAQSSSHSIPKSRKKRLANLYDSDNPPKILFCPAENLKLILCAGDIAIESLVVKPVLYVLSWFI